MTRLPSGVVIDERAWMRRQAGLSTTHFVPPWMSNSVGPYPQDLPSTSNST